MEPSASRSDEVDLLKLLLAQLTRFVLSHWLMLVICIGGSLAVAFYQFRIASPVFESRMLVRSMFLSSTYAAQVIGDLNAQVGQGADTALAAKLNMTVKDAGLLRAISIEPTLTDRFNIPEEEKIVFTIVVEIADPNVLPKLQDGLIYYFENNPFIKGRVSERRKGLQTLTDRIDREIDQQGGQSSPAGTLYPFRPVRPGNRDRFPNPVLFDPAGTRAFLYRDRMEAEEKLVLLKGLEVIHGFSQLRSAIKPRRSVYLSAGLSLGIVVTVILLGLRSMQWLLKKYPA